MTVESDVPNFEGFLASKTPLPSVSKSGPSLFSETGTSMNGVSLTGGPSDSSVPLTKSVTTLDPVVNEPEIDSGDETETYDECDCVEKGPILAGELGTKSFDLMEKWESERYSISWKWNWLQSQVAEVDRQASLCDRRMETLKKKKTNEVTKKVERKNKKASTFLKGSGLKPGFPTSESHLLFQATSKRKRSPERKKQRDRKVESKKDIEELNEPEEQFVPFVTPERKRKRPDSSKRTPTPKGKTAKKSKSPSLSSTSPRRISRSSQFDIDNVVIPFNFSFQSPVVPKIERVDIHTPTFRSLSTRKLSSSSRGHEPKKSVVMNLSFSAPDQTNSSNESDLKEEVESSEEDTDDELYYQRHRPLEIRERRIAGVPIEDSSEKSSFVSRRTVSMGKASERRKSDHQDTFLVTSEMLDPDEEKELSRSSEVGDGRLSEGRKVKRKRENEKKKSEDSMESLQWQVSPKESKQGKIVLCFRVAS